MFLMKEIWLILSKNNFCSILYSENDIYLGANILFMSVSTKVEIVSEITCLPLIKSFLFQYQIF